MPLTLEVLPGLLAVCRLPAGCPLPEWLVGGTLNSVTRSADETSIVCDATVVPPDVTVESNWRAIKIKGPLDFGLAGVLLSVAAWIIHAKLRPDGFLFPSRVRQSPHLTTRQYTRQVNRCVPMVGLDPPDYGTHSLRCTKATLIDRRTKNLRAVQLLLSHRKLEASQKRA